MVVRAGVVPYYSTFGNPKTLKIFQKKLSKEKIMGSLA
jgi:hypothetical protein